MVDYSMGCDGTKREEKNNSRSRDRKKVFLRYTSIRNQVLRIYLEIYICEDIL